VGVTRVKNKAAERGKEDRFKDRDKLYSSMVTVNGRSTQGNNRLGTDCSY